jgi:hypothetical protein
VDEEPDFMKYIKNMNVNYVNKDYLQEHFAEEEEAKLAASAMAAEDTQEIPKELQGLSAAQLE